MHSRGVLPLMERLLGQWPSDKDIGGLSSSRQMLAGALRLGRPPTGAFQDAMRPLRSARMRNAPAERAHAEGRFTAYQGSQSMSSELAGLEYDWGCRDELCFMLPTRPSSVGFFV